MAFKQFSPMPIIEGGTNANGFPNAFGVAYYDGLKLDNVPTGIAGQVLTSNGIAAAPSFEPLEPPFVWNNVTGTTQAASVNNGYIANNAGLVTITLPAVAEVGSIISVQGAGAGGWKIAQNTSQVIRTNGGSSLTGTGGSIASSSQYDSLSLMCITENTNWVIRDAYGNFNVI